MPRNGESSSISEQKARYSIVVPVFEQWNLVPGLLDALSRQNRHQDDVEVILVDNGSSEVVLPEVLPRNVVVLSCESAGSYAARNAGAAAARGDWLLFTDADCRPSPGWLISFESEINRWKGEGLILAGAVLVVAASNQPNAYEIYDMVRGIPQSRYVSRGYAATANLAMPIQLLRSLGGFDEGRYSGGDADFCRRAGKKGARIMYVPQAKVDHPARVTWLELATKARRVKGGQLAAGSYSKRLMWALATLVPPLRECLNLLRNKNYSLFYRLTAVAMQHALWMVQIVELVRIAVGWRPERR